MCAAENGAVLDEHWILGRDYVGVGLVMSETHVTLHASLFGWMNTLGIPCVKVLV